VTLGVATPDDTNLSDATEFQPRQSLFLSDWASCRTGCKRTVQGSL